MTDADSEALVALLAEDGIVITKDEARRAIYRLAELLLLISEPLPLPPSSQEADVETEEDLSRGPSGRVPLHDGQV